MKATITNLRLLADNLKANGVDACFEEYALDHKGRSQIGKSPIRKFGRYTGTAREIFEVMVKYHKIFKINLPNVNTRG